MDKLLRAVDVAAILGVNYDSALDLMKSMQCVNLSPNPNTKNPRYAVTEQELRRWLYERSETPANRNSKARAPRQKHSRQQPLLTPEELFAQLKRDHKKLCEQRRAEKQTEQP